MQIAVLSDSHRHSYELNHALKQIVAADLIIHLGDNVEDVEVLRKGYKGSIINVRGNCDFSAFVPSERLEELNGKKVFITHGHKYGVKSDLLRLKYKAKEVGADIVLFGHTHEAVELYEEGIWFINPGSLALPRNRYKSYALLNIDKDDIKICIRELT
ncbi:metallophosphoesterase [Candidatus Clostridium radicumherbarum]|uniref:Phosphoesterase n=1 Tax=Candidatus Clostridium radicumherbarum TaxID=3381662 RepID=A0ABW8TSU3_9CLOT